MRFATNATESMRIDSSGNLLVGKPTTALATTGSYIAANGLTALTTDSQRPLILNRKTNDGDLIEFNKDSVTVGSIGAGSNNLIIGTGNTGIRFWDGGAAVLPRTPADGVSNGVINLGEASNRFKDLYLSGGVVFGDAGGSGTSSSNTFDSYEEGTWTPTQGNFATWSSPTFDATYVKVGRMVYVRCYQTGGTIGWSNSNRIQGLPFEPVAGASAYATDSGPSSDNGVLLIWVGASVYFQKSNASETALVFSGSY
jgi:hypothetical protein